MTIILINRSRILNWQKRKVELRHRILSGWHKGCYWYVRNVRKTSLRNRGGYDYDVIYKYANGLVATNTFFGVEQGDGISLMELAIRRIDRIVK